MKNLILVNQKNKQALADFEKVKALVAARADDICPHIVDTKQTDWPQAADVAANPTVTVSPMPVRKFVAPRGPVYQGYEFPKSEQYARLRRDGLPVPDWHVIEPGTRLEPQDWGPYVVVKPDLGRIGQEVRIKKTTRVSFKPRDAFPEGHPGRKAAMLAQRFVYTGRWATSYRVVTLFGKAVLAWHCEMDHAFPPLDERYGFASHGGITIASSKRSSTYSLAFDEDIISLAERAHGSFPDQALLGHDLARDCETGEVVILECNPRGDTWLFSSWTGSRIQQQHGLDFYEQFGGLSLVADILVEQTRRRAA